MSRKSNNINALLTEYLEQSGLCKRQVLAVGNEVKRLVIAAAEENAYPRWSERFRYKHLQNLNATEFLFAVHISRIKNKTIIKNEIRLLDPELMTVIESYISNRLKRGQDLGHATGLRFISNFRPAHSRRGQSIITYSNSPP